MKNTYTTPHVLLAFGSEPFPRVVFLPPAHGLFKEDPVLGQEPSRLAALAGALNRPGIEILRYGLVLVVGWIGLMKFTGYEAKRDRTLGHA